MPGAFLIRASSAWAEVALDISESLAQEKVRIQAIEKENAGLAGVGPGAYKELPHTRKWPVGPPGASQVLAYLFNGCSVSPEIGAYRRLWCTGAFPRARPSTLMPQSSQS